MSQTMMFDSFSLGISRRTLLQLTDACLVARNIATNAKLAIFGAVLSLIVISVVALCITQAGSNNRSMSTAYFQALSTVIVPTRVAWPAHYIHSVRDSISSNAHTISIPVGYLIRDVTAGKIELRHTSDLAELFTRPLRVYGFIVRLELEASWKISAPIWMISEYARSRVSVFVARQKHAYQLLRMKVSGISRSVSAMLFPLTSSRGLSQETSVALYPRPVAHDTCPLLCLDDIPSHLVRKRIDAFCASLCTGETAALEFTTLAPSTPFLSVPFFLSGIPFLRCSLSSRQHSSKPGRRLLTPFAITLSGILDLLSTPCLSAQHRKPTRMSSPRAARINSVLNVSSQHAARLLALRDHLENDTLMRTSFVNAYGLEFWRQHRLMLAWEAGLLTAGLLERWVIEFT
ncbi:hypothetical protein FISHEDRAFT_71140 [Fistulina hepatica ATCC 64428]|nr:hypothetical protein FISHEDRAFT_71140 [Fistulina hepatica ATCC 64428]